MFGKKPGLNPIAARKKILILESELNRAQLVQEWRTLADEAHALTNQARTVRSLASAAASLIAGVAALRRKKCAPVAEKPSWLKTILKGAGLVSNFWLAFRPSGREPKDS